MTTIIPSSNFIQSAVSKAQSSSQQPAQASGMTPSEGIKMAVESAKAGAEEYKKAQAEGTATQATAKNLVLTLPQPVQQQATSVTTGTTQPSSVQQPKSQISQPALSYPVTSFGGTTSNFITEAQRKMQQEQLQNERQEAMKTREEALTAMTEVSQKQHEITRIDEGRIMSAQISALNTAYAGGHGEYRWFSPDEVGQKFVNVDGRQAEVGKYFGFAPRGSSGDFLVTGVELKEGGYFNITGGYVIRTTPEEIYEYGIKPNVNPADVKNVYIEGKFSTSGGIVEGKKSIEEIESGKIKPIEIKNLYFEKEYKIGGETVKVNPGTVLFASGEFETKGGGFSAVGVYTKEFEKGTMTFKGTDVGIDTSKIEFISPSGPIKGEMLEKETLASLAEHRTQTKTKWEVEDFLSSDYSTAVKYLEEYNVNPQSMTGEKYQFVMNTAARERGYVEKGYLTTSKPLYDVYSDIAKVKGAEAFGNYLSTKQMSGMYYLAAEEKELMKSHEANLETLGLGKNAYGIPESRIYVGSEIGKGDYKVPAMIGPINPSGAFRFYSDMTKIRTQAGKDYINSKAIATDITSMGAVAGSSFFTAIPATIGIGVGLAATGSASLAKGNIGDFGSYVVDTGIGLAIGTVGIAVDTVSSLGKISELNVKMAGIDKNLPYSVDYRNTLEYQRNVISNINKNAELYDKDIRKEQVKLASIVGEVAGYAFVFKTVEDVIHPKTVRAVDIRYLGEDISRFRAEYRIPFTEYSISKYEIPVREYQVYRINGAIHYGDFGTFVSRSLTTTTVSPTDIGLTGKTSRASGEGLRTEIGIFKQETVFETVNAVKIPYVSESGKIVSEIMPISKSRGMINIPFGSYEITQRVVELYPRTTMDITLAKIPGYEYKLSIYSKEAKTVVENVVREELTAKITEGFPSKEISLPKAKELAISEKKIGIPESIQEQAKWFEATVYGKEGIVSKSRGFSGLAGLTKEGEKVYKSASEIKLRGSDLATFSRFEGGYGFSLSLIKETKEIKADIKGKRPADYILPDILLSEKEIKLTEPPAKQAKTRIETDLLKDIYKPEEKQAVSEKTGTVEVKSAKDQVQIQKMDIKAIEKEAQKNIKVDVEGIISKQITKDVEKQIGRQYSGLKPYGIYRQGSGEASQILAGVDIVSLEKETYAKRRGEKPIDIRYPRLDETLEYKGIAKGRLTDINVPKIRYEAKGDVDYEKEKIKFPELKFDFNFQTGFTPVIRTGLRLPTGDDLGSGKTKGRKAARMNWQDVLSAMKFKPINVNGFGRQAGYRRRR